MKHFLFLFLLTVSAGSFAQPADEAAITGLLQKQAQSWNCGDLKGFMKGYWESDSLLFVGKSGITYGYAQTLANYRKNYPDMDDMGELTFDIKKVDFLAADAAFVLGKWHLKRDAKGDLSGHFTLLFRKIKGQWVIVADHSS
ncbi:MAG TPA: DUF4440 domain-containing protein [Lacibacter sp.]|nr:DUF4440 domain-containing protein [Lacibacter sp.]HMO88367.1 DUF4440 domain-containing protein [Lacibacter sp.]HMP87524.1 DUF4440 domain-containing protein [Lacibacter sp.]